MLNYALELQQHSRTAIVLTGGRNMGKSSLHRKSPDLWQASLARFLRSMSCLTLARYRHVDRRILREIGGLRSPRTVSPMFSRTIPG